MKTVPFFLMIFSSIYISMDNKVDKVTDSVESVL